MVFSPITDELIQSPMTVRILVRQQSVDESREETVPMFAAKLSHRLAPNVAAIVEARNRYLLGNWLVRNPIAGLQNSGIVSPTVKACTTR